MVLTNNLLIYWLCNSLKVFDLIVSFDWYFIDLQSLWKIGSFSPEWLVFQKKKKKSFDSFDLQAVWKFDLNNFFKQI